MMANFRRQFMAGKVPAIQRQSFPWGVRLTSTMEHASVGAVDLRQPTFGKPAKLVSLAVLPSHRRRGFGTSLTEAACAEALRRGAPEITLEARPSDFSISQQGLVALYSNVGFRQTGLSPAGGCIMWKATGLIQPEIRRCPLFPAHVHGLSHSIQRAEEKPSQEQQALYTFWLPKIGTVVHANDEGENIQGTLRGITLDLGFYDAEIEIVGGERQFIILSALYKQPPSTTVRTFSNVKIYHFHQSKKRFSDYVKKGHTADITNHGLGTGFYGVQNLNTGQSCSSQANYSEIIIENPFVLQDTQHFDAFIELSKELQRIADALRGKAPPLVMHEIVEAVGRSSLEAKFARLMQRNNRLVPDSKSTISNALDKFLKKYHDGRDYIRQPINYLMRALGYDGIYSDSPSANNFSRGLVSYRKKKQDVEKYWPKAFYSS